METLFSGGKSLNELRIYFQGSNEILENNTFNLNKIGTNYDKSSLG